MAVCAVDAVAGEVEAVVVEARGDVVEAEVVAEEDKEVAEEDGEVTAEDVDGVEEVKDKEPLRITPPFSPVFYIKSNKFNLTFDLKAVFFVLQLLFWREMTMSFLKTFFCRCKRICYVLLEAETKNYLR
jgi:hypothetical protein